MNVTAAVAVPVHTDWLAIAFTVAVGLTVIVKLIGAPVQPFAEGVTVIVAVIAAPVALVAVKLPILPVPDAARPIAVLLFVQLYVVPDTAPLKLIAFVAALAQSTWFAWPFTFGVGLTVIVKLTGVPVQVRPPLVNVGVTVIVATCGTAVLLIAWNELILPVPVAPRPILVLLLVQVYTVFVTGPLIVTAAVFDPLHKVWFVIPFTLGVGFTVIVKVTGVPTQVPPLDGVIVTVAVIGAPVAFVAMKLGILPAPTAARPMLGWLFVHVKNTPGIGLLSITAVDDEPLHSNWLPGNGGFIVGVGFTVIVNVVGVPTQFTPPLL